MLLKKCALAIALTAVMASPAIRAQMNPVLSLRLMEDDAGTVLGQPCTVVQEDEITRQLPDGTTLTHRTIVHKWRDNEGRFRRKSAEIEKNEPLVFQRASIIDPVNNTFVNLNLERKTATIYHLPDHALHPYVDQFKKEILALPGVQVKTERLGGKTIDGVWAEGRRETRFRPSGTGNLGNDKPIVSVRDQWIAQDLKILLASTLDDPRQREVVKVTNLDRSEPDPVLFQIPADFTVREVSADAREQ